MSGAPTIETAKWIGEAKARYSRVGEKMMVIEMVSANARVARVVVRGWETRVEETVGGAMAVATVTPMGAGDEDCAVGKNAEKC